MRPDEYRRYAEAKMAQSQCHADTPVTALSGVYDGAGLKDCEPQRSGVGRAVSELDNALQYAHDRLSKLIARLDPVLRPSNPQAGTADKALSAPAQSGIAETLGRYASGTTGLSNRINEILDRLDV